MISNKLVIIQKAGIYKLLRDLMMEILLKMIGMQLGDVGR